MAEPEAKPVLRAVIEQNGQLVARHENGQLLDRSGQLYFDFADGAGAARPVAELTATQWFELGCQHERDGQWGDAEGAYRHALRAGGPTPDLCFNLANVLGELGKLESALERLQQTVELDPGHVQAWNNLGIVLAELNQPAEAAHALRTALKLYPAYADAHYNLADALETLGRTTSAKAHWKEYLALEPLGPWADHARRCLGKAR